METFEVLGSPSCSLDEHEIVGKRHVDEAYDEDMEAFKGATDEDEDTIDGPVHGVTKVPQRQQNLRQQKRKCKLEKHLVQHQQHPAIWG